MTERVGGGGDGRSDAPWDVQLDRALTDALRTRPLHPDAIARMRLATEHEWQLAAGKGNRGPATRSLVGNPSARSHFGLWASLAAALGILVLGVLWYASSEGDPPVFGVVARADMGNADVRFQIVRRRALRVGDRLRTGDTLTTHGPALVSLYNGGTLRVAADTVVKVTGQAEASLRHGEIYVDLPPGIPAKSPFRVLTRAGTIEHVGTEFEVLSNDQIVRLRVREGRVRLRAPGEELIAEAGTELMANEAGVVSRRSISVYGSDWVWVAALTPDYEIEGRPLLGFLEWASRELGRPLKFSDAHARVVAERTVLHGSVRGRAPLDALANVLATTSLSYEIRDETIWIQSGHGT